MHPKMTIIVFICASAVLLMWFAGATHYLLIPLHAFNRTFDRGTTSPTPEPFLVPFVHVWATGVAINPLDDTRTTSAMLLSRSDDRKYGARATLVLRCQSSRVDAYIDWQSYLGSDNAQVAYRFGSEPMQSSEWSISTDNRATFFRGTLKEPGINILRYHYTAEAFIEKLMTVDRFVAEVTTSSGTTITAIFDLKDTNYAGQQVLDACANPSPQPGT